MNPIVAAFIHQLQALPPGERIEAIKQFGEQAQTLHFAALDEVREKMRSMRENPITKGET